jgi:hypothetical protein
VDVRVLLWVSAVAVAPLSVWVYHRVALSSSRRHLTLALAVPSGFLVLIISVAVKGSLIAVPVSLLYVSFVLLVSAYAWLVDRLMQERLDRLLSTSNARDRVGRHSLLGRLMRMRRR